MKPDVFGCRETSQAQFEHGHYETRVDGVAVARHELIDEALRAALDRKSSLPQQLVTLHDLRFARIWTVDQLGRILANPG